MTQHHNNIQLLHRVTKGDVSAMDFLVNYWNPYCHQIDDIVDGERPEKRDQLKTFALACELFSHPFYLQHRDRLKQLVLNITLTYADSVDWEKSPDAWRREWADHLRHCGMDMVLAVATICGGYDLAFAISQEQRTICWNDHHDRGGKPI
jgi:hypothetical protein